MAARIEIQPRGAIEKTNELEAKRGLEERFLMLSVTSPTAMQRLARQWKTRGRRIGCVPTMGDLHAGHLSLAQRARRAVGPSGRVVVTIYVNPTQFGPGEDFKKYPRNLERDKQLCREAGVDVVFAPRDGQMYSSGDRTALSTWVVEERLSRPMEGKSRPTHFRGVTTVVAKLFNIVLPDVAVFGEKDYQQAAIVRRMVRDLNFPVEIIVAPTKREPDGLALSSRNAYLAGHLRTQAVALWQSICKARAIVRGARRPIQAVQLRKQLKRDIEQQPDARVDYVEFFDPVTFEALSYVKRGAHLALAVFVGKTRLIDHARL